MPVIPRYENVALCDMTDEELWRYVNSASLTLMSVIPIMPIGNSIHSCALSLEMGIAEMDRRKRILSREAADAKEDGT